MVKKANSHFATDMKIKLLPNSKRSQHEIVGFVLIVLIVSIVGVIFLSISFGNQEVKRETSVEISNLIEASMQHTTDCAVNFIPQYQDIQDLIKNCYNNIGKCLNEEDFCKSLEKNLKEILDKSLMVDENSVNKAYKSDIYYSSGTESQNEEILSFEQGIFANCSSIVGGGNIIPVGVFDIGEIRTELLICKR